jgi:hypothetical protein
MEMLVLTCAHLPRTLACKNKTPGVLTADADLEAKYVFDESLGDSMLGRHVAAGSGEEGVQRPCSNKGNARLYISFLHACINDKSIYASSIACACSLARQLCP